MKNNRKWFLTLIFAVPLILIFSQCLTSSGEKPDPRGELYAGSASCVKCHKNFYDNYMHTAHFTTSRPASEHTINGSFTPGMNAFYFSKDTKVVMEKRNGGLYQVAYFKGHEINAAPFDMAFGGVKAESYLYWKGNQTFQLPISYFKALHNWTNSPGFDTTNADYNRIIGQRCFECHSSYIKEMPQQTQSIKQEVNLDKSSLVFGIDCERCHGPAANHVNYHEAYPEVKKAMYIKTYASLTRPQKIDMCATCHSGNSGHMIKSIFSFKPGDNLADYKEVVFAHENLDSTKMDVHGNQTQMLESSKCFAMTSMNCATCHDVHKNQRQNVAIYSQTCGTCHSAASHNVCTMTVKIGGMIKNNCIDCHMPARASNAIQVQVSGGGKAIPYLVRTHHIAIYKDASNLVMGDLKKYNMVP